MNSATQAPSAGTAGASEPEARPPTRRRRRRLLSLLAGVLVIAIAVVAVIAMIDPFGGKDTGKVAGSRPSGSLARVTRGTLSQQVNATGTLGYVGQADGSPHSVVNQASGIVTDLPNAGEVVHCGRVLYRVANHPVVLLCGRTPAYRSLYEGDSGPDVKELNANLVHLGYATSAELDPSSDYFSSETAYALEQLQDKLGEEETGSLSLDQVVFLPGPVRVAKTTAALGTTARPGTPVMQATSTARQVEVELDASQQSSAKVGAKALVTLPDNRAAPGKVTRIGTVASSSSGSSDSGGSSESSSAASTIPVYVTLKHSKDARGLDEAPVQVQITTAGVKDALIVPIDALLARSGGRYAVETVTGRGLRRLVPVTLGAFDDANGLVQVKGALHAGERIVVPNA